MAFNQNNKRIMGVEGRLFFSFVTEFTFQSDVLVCSEILEHFGPASVGDALSLRADQHYRPARVKVSVRIAGLIKGANKHFAKTGMERA